MKATLRTDSLVKKFGKKTAVKKVSFAMEKGEIVGLLGPNGAGKTTVFYMIAGFLKPTRGSVFLNEKNISSMAMYNRARHGISYLPQEASIFRKLTVKDNIKAILETRSDISKKEKAARLDSLLEEFGIGGLAGQMAYTLSGGERRRTEIARALAMEPSFLLLDEPFAGIDPIAVHEIKRIISSLAEKDIGVLITDHNVRDTLEITHRSFIINQGEILVSGHKDEILESSLAREIYLGDHFRM